MVRRSPVPNEWVHDSDKREHAAQLPGSGEQRRLYLYIHGLRVERLDSWHAQDVSRVVFETGMYMRTYAMKGGGYYRGSQGDRHGGIQIGQINGP